MVKWVIDKSHSEIGFEVKHMMVSKVKGAFETIEGSVEGDPENLEGAKINVKIHTNTINTNNNDRDEHLRSADFFDVENHPYIEFEATNIKSTGEDTYDVFGNITMNGITKEHKFEFEYNGTGKNPWGVTVIGFEGKTKLSRKEFGLTWNQALETGGFLVGDEITVTIEGQLNPAE